MTVLLRGDKLAADILDSAAKRAAHFESATGRRPTLATVLVGDDPASHTYVRMKGNRAKEIGIDARLHLLPTTVTTAELCSLVTSLSEDPVVDGILLQHPVPDHVDERAAFESIALEKDVDGVTMRSFAAVSFGRPAFTSATPGAIIRLLEAYDVRTTGQLAVVVGRSPILGKPVGMMLLQRNATVVFCHSKTQRLAELIAQADIVVAAVGKPEFVRGEWIKDGAVVVDAGYNPGNVGDVEFEASARRASQITPVPGGVGPMTISVLLDQTVDAAYQRTRLAGDGG